MCHVISTRPIVHLETESVGLDGIIGLLPGCCPGNLTECTSSSADLATLYEVTFDFAASSSSCGTLDDDPVAAALFSDVRNSEDQQYKSQCATNNIAGWTSEFLYSEDLGNCFQATLFFSTGVVDLARAIVQTDDGLVGLSTGCFPFLGTMTPAISLAPVQLFMGGDTTAESHSNHASTVGTAAALLLAIGVARAIGRPRATTCRARLAKTAHTVTHHAAVCASLALALVMIVPVVSTITTVTSFAALSAAIVDGADINVAADVTFTSQLTVTGTVAISSSTGATLSGGGSTRLFDVTSGSLSLSLLTLENGAASTSSCDDTTCKGGVAYLTHGRLSLNSIVMSSSTAYQGGAVYATYSNLTVEYCTYTTNSAVNVGGAFYVSNCRAAVGRSIFTSNKAAVNNGGGGGAWYAAEEIHMALTSSTFTTNGAGYVSWDPSS